MQPSDSRRLLPVVFAVIVASFACATLFTQWQLSAVRARSSEIADRVAPNIERLATARGEMRRVQLVLHEYADAPARPRADVEAARHDLDNALAAYPALPNDVASAKSDLDSAIERDLATHEPRRTSDVAAAADRLGARAVTPDRSKFSTHIAVASSRDLHRASLCAREARRLRARVCRRGDHGARRGRLEAHDARARGPRHASSRATRSARVGARRVCWTHRARHREPAQALSECRSGFSAETCTGDERAAILERGANSIERIDRLVDGLLAFAVAGAQPEEGAHADVGDTIADVASELQPIAREAGCALHVDVVADAPIACHAGVLTSIVSNLVRNAIKYTAGCATRRIDVRAFETHDAIRIEVADTGPGLPDDIASRVFAPYVRGKNSTLKKSIGLGLATVKRLVTSHGGVVGVDSRKGEGCTFYVELPKGEAHRAHAPLDAVIA